MANKRVNRRTTPRTPRFSDPTWARKNPIDNFRKWTNPNIWPELPPPIPRTPIPPNVPMGVGGGNVSPTGVPDYITDPTSPAPKPPVRTWGQGLRGGIGKLIKGAGSGLGALGTASLFGGANSGLLEDLGPSASYGPGGVPGQFLTRGSVGVPPIPPPPSPSAEGFELPPLEEMNQGQGPTIDAARNQPIFGSQTWNRGGDVNLPSPPRNRGGGGNGGFLSGRRRQPQVPSNTLEPLTELPGEMTPIQTPLTIDRTESMRKGLTSGHLPDEISLGGSEPNTALGQKSDGIQQNEESAFNRYFRLANSMPERGNYKPNILQRIIAGAAGASEGWFGGAGRGLQASIGHLNRPYEEAVGNWKTQLDELEPLMEMESRRDMKSDDLSYRRERDQLINQSKNRAQEIEQLKVEGNIELQRERNEILMLKAESEEHAKNRQFGLSREKLRQFEERSKALLAIAGQRASTAAEVGKSTIKRNEAAAEASRGRDELRKRILDAARKAAGGQ